MNVPVQTEIRSRWTWRRIAALLLLLIAIIPIAIVILPRDTSRAKATALFHSLTPGMSMAEVHQIMEQAGLKGDAVVGNHFFEIDNRFIVCATFDDKEQLYFKIVYEKGEFPKKHELFLQRIGLPVGKLFLMGH